MCIRDSIQGASQGGVGGFLKGTFFGITGLVVKPVTGILDATSKAAEGIKNTTKLLDDRAVIDQKMRKPRVFYVKDQYFLTYNDFDAEVNTILKLYKGGPYANDHYVNAHQIIQSKGVSEFVLVLTIEHLIFMNKQTGKIEWDTSPKNIEKIDLVQDNLVLYLREPARKTDTTNIKIKLPDTQQAKTIYDDVLRLKESMSN
eukprot:TRINITY_DN2953_c0_g1_i4.p1 TRINITY_DN2953_c0_g1~~TRINITY_DN2953_c0_g1_i4.p1  ORF type:complete len:201 (+),score=43.31 TRINITY_DN2953_c0_g1_i4:66-668(+)